LADMHGAAFSDEFFIGTTVDKDEAAGQRLPRARVGEGVFEHGQPELFARQGKPFHTEQVFDVRQGHVGAATTSSTTYATAGFRSRRCRNGYLCGKLPNWFNYFIV